MSKLEKLGPWDQELEEVTKESVAIILKRRGLKDTHRETSL